MQCSDLIKILDYAVCDPRNSVGYVYLYINSFGIALGVRPNSLWQLTLDKYTKSTVRLRPAYMYIYTERIGSDTGGSKTKRGGIKFIWRQPVQIPLFDPKLLEGCLNGFKIYGNMVSIRPECNKKRVFLHINLGRTIPEQVFKRQHLGKGFFERSVKTICLEAGVTGSGLNGYLTNPGLRSSMTPFLIEAGHTGSSIILRTGHSNTTIMARYHNMRDFDGPSATESVTIN